MMFKDLNFFALFLAFLVILMFIGAAISIAEHNILTMLICILLGGLIMSYGIFLKVKRNH